MGPWFWSLLLLLLLQKQREQEMSRAMKAAEVQERFEYIKSRAAEAGAMDSAKRQQYAEKLMVRFFDHTLKQRDWTDVSKQPEAGSRCLSHCSGCLLGPLWLSSFMHVMSATHASSLDVQRAKQFLSPRWR